jgi:hypothetical protein
MTWWIRAYLAFAAIQGLGIGLTGLLLPSEMQIPLRISPLNARFVAALYIAGGVGVLWACIRARSRGEARLFVQGFGLATALILIVTLTHWQDFMADDLPHRPIWIFDYVVDPLLALVLIPLAHLWPPRTPTHHRLTRLLLVQTALFGVLGIALLATPATVAALWPWALPPILGQVYACFFITFGVSAFLAARESEPRAITAFVASTLLLTALVLLVSVLHIDRFKPEPVTWLWFAAFGLLTAVFAAALLGTRSVLRPAPATVP